MVFENIAVRVKRSGIDIYFISLFVCPEYFYNGRFSCYFTFDVITVNHRAFDPRKGGEQLPFHSLSRRAGALLVNKPETSGSVDGC